MSHLMKKKQKRVPNWANRKNKSPLTEKEEEVLEFIGSKYEKDGHASIKRLDLADTLGSSPALVNKLLDKLEERGLIVHERWGDIKFTEEGRRISNAVMRRHRISEALFKDILGLNEVEAHEFACKFEHILNDNIAERIEDVLKKFPLQTESSLKKSTENFPLTAFPINTTVQISKIILEDPDYLKKCTEIGVQIGTEVKIIGSSPLDGTLLVEIANNLIPVGKETASILWGFAKSNNEA